MVQPDVIQGIYSFYQINMLVNMLLSNIFLPYLHIRGGKFINASLIN